MISPRDVEKAVDTIVQHAAETGDSVSTYRDEDGVPLVIVTQCSHCAELFDKFAKLNDDEKQRAIQAVIGDETRPKT